MAVEKILETDTLNQGRVKINNILDDVAENYSELKSDLDELYQVTKPLNFIDTLSFTDGIFIRNQDGEVRQNASFTS